MFNSIRHTLEITNIRHDIVYNMTSVCYVEDSLCLILTISRVCRVWCLSVLGLSCLVSVHLGSVICTTYKIASKGAIQLWSICKVCLLYFIPGSTNSIFFILNILKLSLSNYLNFYANLPQLLQYPN